jgi:hypothetical protein
MRESESGCGLFGFWNKTRAGSEAYLRRVTLWFQRSSGFESFCDQTGICEIWVVWNQDRLIHWPRSFPRQAVSLFWEKWDEP